MLDNIFIKKNVIVYAYGSIGNHGYIGTSILRIYRKYRRNIDEYFFTNIGGEKIIKNS